MSDFAAFFGHLHPVIVHLPIGIFLLLGALEVAGAVGRARGLSWLPSLSSGQRAFVLVLGAASAVISATFGWLLAQHGSYDDVAVASHQWLGFAAAAASLLLVLLRRGGPTYGVGLGSFLVLLTFAAHYGGKLTHGSDYLVSSLPPSWGRFFGVTPPPAKTPTVAAKAPVTFQTATVYENVVHPIIKERCENCHGPTNSKGGLRLDTWEAMLKGGKHGPALKPNDPAGSLFAQRVDLPAEAKEHMPPKAKAQLGSDDLSIIDWWVARGAPRADRVAKLDLPPAIEDILASRLGGNREGAVPDRATTLASAAALAQELGIRIRPLTPDGPWLEVNARSAGRKFGDAELARLQPLAGAIQWLDLGTTAVTDRGLAAISPMHQLLHLHLDQTAVSDAGTPNLTGLTRLQYLNLRGTKITDQTVTALRTLPHLRALYVWQTAATPAAVKALGDELVDQRRIDRLRAQEVDLGRAIEAEKFQGDTGDTLRPVEQRAGKTADKKQSP
ncbi:MAG TPA: c-type cytochrome domain-containing protein [Candidatus Didemnitutus sp.]|nr:c-type cytochrome domain-containing protein [Candidatus Didemnitutus sp.]